MGFFKDFKDDLSDAVDEMLPGGKSEDLDADDMVSTLDEDIDVSSELSKLDGLLEQVAKKVDEPEKPAPINPEPVQMTVPEPVAPAPKPEVKSPVNIFRAREENRREERKMSDSIDDIVRSSVNAPAPASDENAVITSGMTITGNLDSTGSIEVNGTINGDVHCNGKITVA
nr:polymer-forming cytoskeletal protein [Lachnospiraceae bacterium]